MRPLRPLESNAERGGEATYDVANDPFYTDAAPRGGGLPADFLDGHLGLGHGGHHGPGGGGFPNLGNWTSHFEGVREHGVRDVDTSSERGGLAR